MVESIVLSVNRETVAVRDFKALPDTLEEPDAVGLAAGVREIAGE